MMKVWMKMAVTLALLFTLCGCASNYVIATKEGEMLLTHSKPILDKDTGMIVYIDEEGNEKHINNDRVSQIIER